MNRAYGKPTADRRFWDLVAKLGCIVGARDCLGVVTIHHAGTGAGGRKNYKKVLPLCYEHHLGVKGINGGKMSRREWEKRYWTEGELLERVGRMLSVERTAY